MQFIRSSWLARYGLAVLFMVLALGFRAALDPLLADQVPLSTLYGAVAASIWFAGLGPAVLCAAVGFLPAIYLFADPAFLRPDAPHLLPAVFSYCVSAALIIGVGHAARLRDQRGQEALRSSNELESAHARAEFVLTRPHDVTGDGNAVAARIGNCGNPHAIAVHHWNATPTAEL